MLFLCNMIDSKKDLLKFHKLYEKFKNTMYSVAYDILKNSYDAEDIVENALIKVINIIDDIDIEDIEKPRCKNLMITITKNTAIDYLRKVEHAPMPCDSIENHQIEKSAEDVYFDMENYKEVISCIGELDEKYKDILRLKILHHLKSKNVGEILNISEHSVNMRFMRAKKILANKLKEQNKK